MVKTLLPPQQVTYLAAQDERPSWKDHRKDAGLWQPHPLRATCTTRAVGTRPDDETRFGTPSLELGFGARLALLHTIFSSFSVSLCRRCHSSASLFPSLPVLLPRPVPSAATGARTGLSASPRPLDLTRAGSEAERGVRRHHDVGPLD
jgi:hypothetical protein